MTHGYRPQPLSQSARFTVELVSALGVELPLAVAAGGALAGVSAGAGVALGAWTGGTEATVSVAFPTGLGVEGVELIAVVFASVLEVEGIGVDAGALELAVSLGLADTDACVFASAFAPARDERDAVSWLERLEVLVLAELLDGAFAAFTLSAAGAGALAVASLRLGACGATAAVSGCVAAVSAGAALGADLLASATMAARFAGGGGVFSEPLRLWSISSAPPMTVAVMAPNAIPK